MSGDYIWEWCSHISSSAQKQERQSKNPPQTLRFVRAFENGVINRLADFCCQHLSCASCIADLGTSYSAGAFAMHHAQCLDLSQLAAAASVGGSMMIMMS